MALVHKNYRNTFNEVVMFHKRHVNEYKALRLIRSYPDSQYKKKTTKEKKQQVV